jgi:hypothetical protein
MRTRVHIPARWPILAVVTLTAVLAACGGSGSSEDDTPGPVIPLYRAGEGNPELGALIRRRLAVEGPCLFVDSEGSRFLPIFPHTAEIAWDHEAGLLHFGDRTYRPGDSIGVGGGAMSASFRLDDSRRDWVQEPELSCEFDIVWLAGRNPVP